MENSEYLVILTTPSRNDGVRLQINEPLALTANIETCASSSSHMETAIQTLRSGTGDIVAMSAFDWIKHDVEGLAIAGLCPEKSRHGFWWPMTSRSTWSNVRE